MHKNWMQHQDKSNEPSKKLWDISKDYKNDYQPDVDKGLEKLKARIGQTKSIPIHSAKTIPIVRRRQWLSRIAASIAFLLVSAFLFNLFTKEGTSLQQIVATDILIEQVVLPDGSVVSVNKFSQLSFPETFADSERVVELKGEAFFKVAKNANQPFIVQTASSRIKVLGTEFNVSAYEEEATTEVQVEEGSVAFIVKETNEQKILKANEKIIFNQADGTLGNTKPISWNDTAWKASQLDFVDQPLSVVFDYLLNNFDVEVDFDIEKIGNCPFNGLFVKNTPEAILKQVKSAFDSVKLKKVHSKYYQLSGTCD